jgi:hypothetical protein
MGFVLCGGQMDDGIAILHQSASEVGVLEQSRLHRDPCLAQLLQTRQLTGGFDPAGDADIEPGAMGVERKT